MRVAALPLLIAGLLVGCGGSSGPDGAAGAAQQQATAAAPGQETVDQLLARANAAWQAEQLFDPAKDNAFSLFLEVTKRATPGDADASKRRRLLESVDGSGPQQQARAALNDLLPYGVTRVEQALRAGELNDAGRIIGMLERAHPDAAAVKRLRDSHTRAMANAKNTLRTTPFDSLPRLVSKSLPSYPPRARRMKIEGWVHLSFDIQGDGSVANVRVMASDPPRTFDKEAAKAVGGWRFEAPQRPIPGVQQRLDFELFEDDA